MWVPLYLIHLCLELQDLWGDFSFNEYLVSFRSCLNWFWFEVYVDRCYDAYTGLFLTPFVWNIILQPFTLRSSYDVFLGCSRIIYPIFPSNSLVCIFLLETWEHWCWEFSMSVFVDTSYFFIVVWVLFSWFSDLILFIACYFLWEMWLASLGQCFPSNTFYRSGFVDLP